MVLFRNRDENEIKTLAEELTLAALNTDDVDELGFPRKKLTETQSKYVKKLYEKERGSSDVAAIPKSVIFDIIVKKSNNDPFHLKIDEPTVIDTPDNKWWHRWTLWLEEKRKEEERRKQKAAEQAKIISDSMNHKPLNQQTIGKEKGKGLLLEE